MLSMCVGSFLCCLRVMDGGFFPISFVSASWRVLVICGWLRSARAFSLAMRYILSCGLETLGCFLYIG